jgi:hypothetical protein
MRFQVSMLVLVGLFGHLGISKGSERPAPPATPHSIEDCKVFEAKQVEFAKAAQKASEDCYTRQLSAKSGVYVSFPPSCGGVPITAYSACKQEFEAAWCSWNGFGDQYNACVKTTGAKTLERIKLDEDLARQLEIQETIRRELRLDHCSGGPAIPDSTCK